MQLGEERVYFTHSSPSKSVRTGAQESRNLKAGDDARAMGERCLLACPHGFLGLPSYRAQDQPMHGPITNSEMTYRLAYRAILWKYFVS